MITATAEEPEEWRYREFTVTGKIYSPKRSIAEYRVYWALRNSEFDDAILIDDIAVGEGQE